MKVSLRLRILTQSTFRLEPKEQQRRWTQVYDLARLTNFQEQLLSGFVREMKILVYSGIWCGDCVQQGPLLQRIVEGNPEKIDLRFIERQMNTELIEDLRITEAAGFLSSCSFRKTGAGVPPLETAPSIATVHCLKQAGPQLPNWDRCSGAG